MTSPRFRCVYIIIFSSILLFRDTSLFLDFLFFLSYFSFIVKKGLNVFIGSSRLGEHLLFRSSRSVCVCCVCVCVFIVLCANVLQNLFLARNMNELELD